MTIWRQVAALALPLCILSCSTTGANTAIADSLVEVETSPLLTSLRTLPPAGLDSLDESDFRYFRNMGPLEYAVRLGGTPAPKAWNVRLRLYPAWQDSDLLYQVKVDHYNLSPVIYAETVSIYGDADPILDDSSPHQHMYLEFLPVMNTAASWLSGSTQISESDVATNPICGLGVDCTDPDIPVDSEWTDSQTVTIAPVPWASDSDPLPTMVRSLAQQAGWLQDGQWITPREIPPGTSEERPWIEVLVTNYAGNGGGYVAHWIERAADDSVRATVHQLYYDGREPSGYVSRGYVCGRGDESGQIRAICP
ncbi:MAG: hypothetical protein AAGD25_23850 [Cyanobacteria bacterium P01_F01_bin.150]